MYKKLDNGIKLFIITKAFYEHLPVDAGKGDNVDYVLIEKSVYDEVRQNKDLWAICQILAATSGNKIEKF